ncbi:MAG: YidC/Oxa1 family membrane protein insertase [Patescibacteria group bacterium]|jgi:YidC/Oxa1 family membrane protein insertase
MIELFNKILFEPILNLLLLVYHYLPPHDLGTSIIVVTILLKLLLFIPSWSSIKSQQAMQEIQPKLDALRKKYENNKEELSRQLLVFYRENKINPLSSCLPVLIQFPILIALYQVFIAVARTHTDTGLLTADQLNHVYSGLRGFFTDTPIKTMFIGLLDLKAKNYVMAGIAAVLQFWQTRMLMKTSKAPAAGTKNLAQSMSRQMAYTMPIVTFIFGASVPSGLAMYWAVSTLFQVAQQYLFIRRRRQLAASNDVIEQKPA